MGFVEGAVPVTATSEGALITLAKRRRNRMLRETGAPSGRDLLGFSCECADPDCHRVLWLTADVFARASADPTWHALAPAHDAVAADVHIADRGLLETVLDLDGIPDMPTTRAVIGEALGIPAEYSEFVEHRLEHNRELGLLDRDEHGNWHVTLAGLDALSTSPLGPRAETPAPQSSAETPST